MTEAEAVVRRIVITFPDNAPADPTVALENVTLGQLGSAAWLLHQVAQEQRKAAAVQAAMERAATVEFARGMRAGRD